MPGPKNGKSEADPTGLSAKTPGAKLDAGKPPVYRGVIAYFPRALRAVADISQKGAVKYSWKGWQKVDDGINRYRDALGRHITDMGIDGPIDPSTGWRHSAQLAWNALAALELELMEEEKKDGSTG